MSELTGRIILARAREVLTTAEYDTWMYRHALGWTFDAIAAATDVDRSTAIRRAKRASAKMANEFKEAA